MDGVGLRGLLYLAGLLSAFAAHAQPASDAVIAAPDMAVARSAIHRIPPVDPNWQPPSLPAGAQPAEEIEPLQGLRDHEIDYPREARIAQREGVATVGFMIDAAGAVHDCIIVKSSGDIYLDTGSCALIVARGLYRPARDPGGNPVSSGQTVEIPWDLAWDEVQPLTERIVRLSYILHTDGSFSDCWLDRGDGTAGVSHLEMCVGTWPDHVLAMLHGIAGPGDLQIQTISGYALSEETMDRQMAEPRGWVRYNGSGAWHLLDETGAATTCLKVRFPGGTSWPDVDPCTPSTRRFARVGSDTGQAADWRIGIHYAWYVAVPES